MPTLVATSIRSVAGGRARLSSVRGINAFRAVLVASLVMLLSFVVLSGGVGGIKPVSALVYPFAVPTVIAGPGAPCNAANGASWSALSSTCTVKQGSEWLFSAGGSFSVGAGVHLVVVAGAVIDDVGGLTSTIAAGAAVILKGGQITMSGAATALTNGGTVAVDPASYLIIGTGSTFTNLAAATYIVTNGNTLVSGTFDNSASGVVSSYASVFTIAAGTSTNAGTMTARGLFQVLAGATFVNSGVMTAAAANRFYDFGTLDVVAPGSIDLTTASQLSVIDGGALSIGVGAAMTMVGSSQLFVDSLSTATNAGVITAIGSGYVTNLQGACLGGVVPPPVNVHWGGTPPADRC